MRRPAPTPMGEPVRPICDWSKNEGYYGECACDDGKNERSSKELLVLTPSSRLVSVVLMRAFGRPDGLPALQACFPSASWPVWMQRTDVVVPR